MIKRHTPLKRYVRINTKRSTPRRGQPTRAEKLSLRHTVYDGAHGLCQLNLSPACISGVLPWAGSVWSRAHLVHVRSRAVAGWDLSNLRLGCWHCHLVEMHTKGKKISA